MKLSFFVTFEVLSSKMGEEDPSPVGACGVVGVVGNGPSVDGALYFYKMENKTKVYTNVFIRNKKQ